MFRGEMLSRIKEIRGSIVSLHKSASTLYTVGLLLYQQLNYGKQKIHVRTISYHKLQYGSSLRRSGWVASDMTLLTHQSGAQATL